MGHMEGLGCGRACAGLGDRRGITESWNILVWRGPSKSWPCRDTPITPLRTWGSCGSPGAGTTLPWLCSAGSRLCPDSDALVFHIQPLPGVGWCPAGDGEAARAQHPWIPPHPHPSARPGRTGVPSLLKKPEIPLRGSNSFAAHLHFI